MARWMFGGLVFPGQYPIPALIVSYSDMILVLQQGIDLDPGPGEVGTVAEIDIYLNSNAHV